MQPLPARRWMTAALAMALGAALRWYFMHFWPMVAGDSLVYGDIAQNLLLHGVYGVTRGDGIHPTLIRLPGYPLFLAFCFRIFGVGKYQPVLGIQLLADLASCLLIAAFVRRTSGDRAATIALFLGALCPFTGSYTAAPLTETLSIFCIALALYAFVAELQQPGPWPLLLLTFSCSYAALLRPDGALLAVTLLPSLVIYAAFASPITPGGLRRFASPQMGWQRALRIAFVAGFVAVLPFLPWTIRNWRTFHVVEPLAPRYATDPGEFPAPGFQRWTRTWCVDFASTQEIYWNANDEDMDVADLPERAFDSPEQQKVTETLLEDYNAHTTLTPEIDARFAALAETRVRSSPLRYYLVLPLSRVLNMWLRPRVEALPVDLRWWQYSEHPAQTLFCSAYGALNLLMVLAGVAGLFLKPRLAGALVAYMLLRSALLATVEAPETRYTLECFPMIIALGSVALARIGSRGSIDPLPS